MLLPVPQTSSIGSPSNSSWGGCSQRDNGEPLRCVASTDNLVPLDVCTPTFPPGLHQYSRSWVVGCFCVKVRGAGWGLKRRFDDVLGVWGGGGEEEGAAT
jgi:hypothetical protein